MEITVHIPSIDNLAKAIEALATAKSCNCIKMPEPPEITPELLEELKNAPLIITPATPAPAPAPEPIATLPSAPPPDPVATANFAPVQTVTHTRQQLSIAATGLVDAGKKQDLLNLLADFHIKSMTELQEEQFGAFAIALRGLGATI